MLLGGLNVMRQRLGHTQRGHRTCRLCWIIRERSEKVLLADASKWERPSIIRFAEWNEIDDWITDKPLTVKETKKLRSFGLSLHVARGWKHL